MDANGQDLIRLRRARQEVMQSTHFQDTHQASGETGGFLFLIMVLYSTDIQAMQQLPLHEDRFLQNKRNLLIWWKKRQPRYVRFMQPGNHFLQRTTKRRIYLQKQNVRCLTDLAM